MADTAAQLVDRVLPEVPIRQWVLTLPYPLRLDAGAHRRGQGAKRGPWAERFVTVGHSETCGSLAAGGYRMSEEGTEKLTPNYIPASLPEGRKRWVRDRGLAFGDQAGQAPSQII
jgi:hypothetical protein